MKAVVEIDMNTPQAKQLLEFIKTLPFAKVKENKALSKWDEAIKAGAITLDEFGERFKEEIHKAYRA